MKTSAELSSSGSSAPPDCMMRRRIVALSDGERSTARGFNTRFVDLYPVRLCFAFGLTIHMHIESYWLDLEGALIWILMPRPTSSYLRIHMVLLPVSLPHNPPIDSATPGWQHIAIVSAYAYSRYNSKVSFQDSTAFSSIIGMSECVWMAIKIWRTSHQSFVAELLFFSALQLFSACPCSQCMPFAHDDIPTPKCDWETAVLSAKTVGFCSKHVPWVLLWFADCD